MHVNSSDLFAVRAVGIDLSTRMRVVWRRGKTNINRLLGNTPTTHESACRLPYEIVEMIITRIAHDLNTLKACSLTCHSWYIAAVPHLHYTLTLTTRGKLKPLSKVHQLGLMPRIKEIRVQQDRRTWLVPQAFSRRDLHYSSAFANVQTLILQYLDIFLFIPGIERYFGHFSPTLRSIALLDPCCTPGQLSHFLSLFPSLDDITIRGVPTRPPNVTIPDTELIPFSTPRLRGRLVLCGSGPVEAWTRLIASDGGLRFHCMSLFKVGRCAPVLFEACAETLETLQFYALEGPGGE